MTVPPFQTFFERHRGPVYGFLVAAVGGAEADDCFQETFLSALRGYPGLRDGSDLRAWIFTIAERKAIDHYRRKSRTPQPMETLPDRGVDGSSDLGEPGLWRAVRALPPKQRAAIAFRYVNDLPYVEIAKLLGCSEQAARQNVRAGLTKLKEVWT